MTARACREGDGVGTDQTELGLEARSLGKNAVNYPKASWDRPRVTKSGPSPAVDRWFRRMTPPLSALAVLACVITGAAGAYLQVRPGYEYVFPADYFAHPEFRAEWWYYTGNLDTRDGRAFGYELTFFRIGLDRVQQTEPRSAWDLTQVYLAHFALTDVAAGRLHKAERVNRSGPGLAGASLSKSTIWNGNWSVEYSLDEPELPVQRLWAGHGDIVLDLELLARQACGDPWRGRYQPERRCRRSGFPLPLVHAATNPGHHRDGRGNPRG